MIIKKKSYHEYEETIVEKPDKTEVLPEESLITIDDNFSEIGKVAFNNCKRLNPIQTLVYDQAYKTCNNMLVAAPTGAGKTNVAMMAIVKELENWFVPDTLQKISNNIGEKFKIVYIAPMKSLATEQTANFNSRLKKIGIKASELTGEMSLTEKEMGKTHILVTTPEKWDVVTRKSKGDTDLLSLVKLLIIDEVHLLQSDRGPVLEALVARTLRYVESSQKMTRIVGLSATLPNYHDVAEFLKVDPKEGLFYFDQSYRPVPLSQSFIGVRAVNSNAQSRSMDRICYNLILQNVMQSKQVMIFVHSRNSTQKTANKLRELIIVNNKLDLFEPDPTQNPEAVRKMKNIKNSQIRDLFAIGFGIHHAGMIRPDRLLVEELFRLGFLKVLVCTATLAWGVNFPAHTVIIRGTEIYDATLGKFTDIGLLDVTQIFGRAGRPQYDSEGNAVIISSLDKMDFYLKLLTNQTPIESKFNNFLADNLNAEVVSGTISSIEDAMQWIKYTYLFIRLAQNPLNYGFDQLEVELDPDLCGIMKRLLVQAAKALDESQMCRFSEDTGRLEAVDLGRIASHFYIKHESIIHYQELLKDELEPEEILNLIAEAQEFRQIKFREEERIDLQHLKQLCRYPISADGIESPVGKVSCLIQAYISQAYIKSHSLSSDIMYIAQNATRIGRGLFEYSLRRGWPRTSFNLLTICKMIESRAWDSYSPLRKFNLPFQVIERLENSKLDVGELIEKSDLDIAKIVRFPEQMGKTIKTHLTQLPYVEIEPHIMPIKSNLITIEIAIKPEFIWNNTFHGFRQAFWFWISDDEITNQIYHSELVKFTKEQIVEKKAKYIRFNIPLVDDKFEDGTISHRLPNNYMVTIMSDDWFNCDYEFPICFRKVNLPNDVIAYTKIPPNLSLLTLGAIQNDFLAEIFRCEEPIMSLSMESILNQNIANNQSGYFICLPPKIDKFNTLQSQTFHTIYRSDKNALICAPPGSGKTLMADIALLRIMNFKDKGRVQKHKIIYITPKETLAILKYRDWCSRIGSRLGKHVMFLSTRNLHNQHEYDNSSIIVSSSEIFCSWLRQEHAQSNLEMVSLIIYDDLHLIGYKMGASLEVVISQINYLKTINNKIRACRLIGISNTVMNAHDLANWLGIKKYGAYNFHPATSRPIQLDIHFIGFSERHYSPRMASMNKPIYESIRHHSSKEPVMIFVSSKKQCITTAQDLITCLAETNISNPDSELKWLKIDHDNLDTLLTIVQDDALKLSLEFGIGFLYPTMKTSDKMIVSDLFLHDRIQVLICTTDFVWQTNYHSKLVIVKGTEHYDEDMENFTDYQPADVMQMLGRAGRPGIDATGVSILMIRDIHKEFYKKFLYETFPVESRLFHHDSRDYLKDYLMEIGKRELIATCSAQSNDCNSNDVVVITSKPKYSKTSKSNRSNFDIENQCISKLSKTFVVRRLSKNPSYYGFIGGIEEFLSKKVDDIIKNSSPSDNPRPMT